MQRLQPADAQQIQQLALFLAWRIRAPMRESAMAASAIAGVSLVEKTAADPAVRRRGAAISSTRAKSSCR